MFWQIGRCQQIWLEEARNLSIDEYKTRSQEIKALGRNSAFDAQELPQISVMLPTYKRPDALATHACMRWKSKQWR